MILKIFSPKKWRKNAFLTQNKAKLCINDIDFLEKTTICSPKIVENRRKW
jgi:hypothetical protein